MNIEEELQRLEYMWTTHKDDYALVPTGNSANGADRYYIVDHANNRAPIIENGKLAQEVKQRMLAAGVFVGHPDTMEFKKGRIKQHLSQYESGGITVDKGRLKALEYMWATRKDDFMLVRAGRNEDGSTRYTIEERAIHRAVFLENEDLTNEVKLRMLAAGVLIGDSDATARRM